MKETMQLEVCHECFMATLTGVGETWRIHLLLREFKGKLTIFESMQITTFRPCGACGIEVAGVRYGAVATFNHEEAGT